MNFPALLVGFTAASLLGTAVVAAPAAAVPRPDATLAAAPAADSGPTMVSDPVDAALSPALRDLPVSSPPANPGEVPEGQPDPGTVPGGDQPGAANDSGSAQREIVGEAPADLVPVNSFAGGTAGQLRGPVDAVHPARHCGGCGPEPLRADGQRHVPDLGQAGHVIGRADQHQRPVVRVAGGYPLSADQRRRSHRALRPSRRSLDARAVLCSWDRLPDVHRLLDDARPDRHVLHIRIRHAQFPRLREVRYLARRSLHVHIRPA